jgi:hypothetical protein
MRCMCMQSIACDTGYSGTVTGTCNSDGAFHFDGTCTVVGPDRPPPVQGGAKCNAGSPDVDALLSYAQAQQCLQASTLQHDPG